MTYQYFFVTLYRDNKTTITHLKQKIMIQLTNINEHGLKYISMAIIDMVTLDGSNPQPEHGMYVGGTYLTPETCYWLYKLLQESPELYAKRTAMEMLRKGTNAPETLK